MQPSDSAQQSSQQDSTGNAAEQLVRDRVKCFFQQQQFEVHAPQGNHRGADVTCWQLPFPGGGQRERWWIEAKGWTPNSTDQRDRFLMGLGQIVLFINTPKECPHAYADETVFYGLALPDRPAFRKRGQEITAQVQNLLAFHWIWVPIGLASAGTSMEITIHCPTPCSCRFSSRAAVRPVTVHRFFPE